MTTEELRAIDAQVAEMFEPKPKQVPPHFHTYSPNARWQGELDAKGGFRWGAAEPYSTDLNAAMRAYEEFRKQRSSKGGSALLELGETIWRDPEKQWYVEIDIGQEVAVSAVAPTPALAICLALLEAAKR